MSFAKIFAIIKNNWLTFLLCGILVLLLVSSRAKSTFLQVLSSTGLFNADINKNALNKSNSLAVEFDYTDKQGNISNTAALKGKVVFINLWATWCPPCVAEMPSLEQLYQTVGKDNRVVFLFLNEDDNSSRGFSYMEEKGFTLPVYKTKGKIPGNVFTGTLPTTVVLDKTGRIVFIHEGMGRYDTDQFVRQLKELF